MDSGGLRSERSAIFARMVDDLPDWERLLAAERHLQHLVPGSVLVGETAAALHAQHRRSLDGDHVVQNLKERFDDVLTTLEQVTGWQTERIQKPVLILGTLDGILTGIRQLRRTAPLQTEIIEGIRVPTLAEMARIKAWLLVTRYTVRDYLDTVVLLERLGGTEASQAFEHFDALYAQLGGGSALAELVERLAATAPIDIERVDLESYKGLVAPWNVWSHLQARGRFWAQALLPLVMQGNAP